MTPDDMFSKELHDEIKQKERSIFIDIAFTLAEIRDYAEAVRKGLASPQAFVVIEADVDRLADLIAELMHRD